MYRVSKDRRFVKNRDALQLAFVRLALAKPYSDITVTDIAREAGVNRMTFYSHYGCIEDIIREIADQMAGELEAHADSLATLDAKAFFRFAEDYRMREPEFFMLAAKDNEYALLRDLVRENMRKMLEKRLFKRTTLTGNDLKVCAGVIASGLCGSYWDWVSGVYGDISLDRLLAHYQRLIDGAIANI